MLLDIHHLALTLLCVSSLMHRLWSLLLDWQAYVSITTNYNVKLIIITAVILMKDLVQWWLAWSQAWPSRWSHNYFIILINNLIHLNWIQRRSYGAPSTSSCRSSNTSTDTTLCMWRMLKLLEQHILRFLELISILIFLADLSVIISVLINRLLLNILNYWHLPLLIRYLSHIFSWLDIRRSGWWMQLLLDCKVFSMWLWTFWSLFKLKLIHVNVRIVSHKHWLLLLIAAGVLK